MAISTCDILLEGIRRDQVFEWLSDRAHHRQILEGAFDGLEELAPGDFDLTMKVPSGPITMEYRYDKPDDSHAGRRVLVNTTGRRTRGKLSYSLRTMKPSTNTLVTLHMDYVPGRVIGPILDSLFINQKLESCLKVVLENVSREIPRTS